MPSWLSLPADWPCTSLLSPVVPSHTFWHSVDCKVFMDKVSSVLTTEELKGHFIITIYVSWINLFTWHHDHDNKDSKSIKKSVSKKRWKWLLKPCDVNRDQLVWEICSSSSEINQTPDRTLMVLHTTTWSSDKRKFD